MHRHDYYPTPDGRAVRPLWGYATEMLVDGYGWRGLPGEAPRGWKPKQGEPDPRISNRSFTATIACKAKQAGWSPGQLHDELMRLENKGGAYYRFRWLCQDGGPKFLEWLMSENTYSSEESAAWVQDQGDRMLGAGVDPRFMPKAYRASTSPTDQYGTRIGQLATDGACWVWREIPREGQEPIRLSLKKAQNLLGFLRHHGTGSRRSIKRDCVAVSARMVETYLSHLECAGLVTMTKEKIPDPQGRKRLSCVYRVASPVEAELALADVRGADRKLWEFLAAPDETPPAFRGSLEDLLASPLVKNTERSTEPWPPGRVGLWGMPVIDFDQMFYDLDAESDGLAIEALPGFST